MYRTKRLLAKTLKNDNENSRFLNVRLSPVPKTAARRKHSPHTFLGLAVVVTTCRTMRGANPVTREDCAGNDDVSTDVKCTGKPVSGASPTGKLKFRTAGRFSRAHQLAGAKPVRAFAAKCLLLVNELTRRNVRARKRAMRPGR